MTEANEDACTRWCACVLTGASERAGGPASDEAEAPEVFEAAVAEGAAHARRALAVTPAAARSRHRRTRRLHTAGGEQRRRGGQPVACGNKKDSQCIFFIICNLWKCYRQVHFSAAVTESDINIEHG